MIKTKNGEAQYVTDTDAARDFLQRKYAAEKKILATIESLIDPVDERALLQSAHVLRPSDYSEVLTERNCIELCGYPICSRKAERIGHTRSFDHKRLVMRDTSDDPVFCSSSHRKASRFFQMQLSETSLWYRSEGAGDKINQVQGTFVLLDESDVAGSLRSWLDKKEIRPVQSVRKAQIDAGRMEIKEKETIAYDMDLDDDNLRQSAEDVHAQIEGYTPKLSLPDTLNREEYQSRH